MRVPLSWLSEYVSLPEQPAQLIERLTLAGLECAGVEVFGKPSPEGVRVKPEDSGLLWERDKVLVAKVLKIEKHPDADKLKMVTLDYGATEPKTVITGAPNIAPGQSGMKVVLGLRGTRYYYTDKEGKKAVFTLEPKALRGIMNDAMCMSNYELGIAEDHDGIIILDDNDPAPGTPLQDVLGEIVIDLDVLPNMARCLSLLGIAREVSALTGAPVAEPVLPALPLSAPSAGSVQIEIADAKLCPRYTATVISKIQVGPAPRAMRSRLHYAGMRPINNVVDITNFVMLEYGQPLHAFDYDVLVKRAGGKVPTIIVRPAKPGEILVTLDKIERKLGPENLVIADTVGPIALAGVMGGLETEVTESTTTMLLESASFDFVSVRKTARQFTLFSEASTRFSRGIHPEIVPLAAKRAIQLLCEHAGGAVVGGIVDLYPAPLPKQTVTLNRSEIERILGISIPDAEVERVLTALQFQLASTPWGWTVTVPATRLDIQAGAADLIEELARVSGYDRLPGRLPAQELPPQSGNRELTQEEHLRDLLADAGLTECITYSLTSPEAEQLIGFSEQDHVALLNPGAPERSILRRSLLPGLFGVAQENFKTATGAAGVALFELGPVFIPRAGSQLPDEPKRLALLLSGRKTEAAFDDPLQSTAPQFDFYDLKGVLESVVDDLHISGVSFAVAEDVVYLHPRRAARILLGTEVLGSFGELHPKVAASLKLTDRPVLVAELDLDLLLRAIPARYPYKPISPLPPVLRDIAVVVGEEIPSDRVVAEIRSAGGAILEAVRLFDVYRGESIGAGAKSLAFALTYRTAERELNDKEVDKTHSAIETKLKQVLKAKIRGRDG